MGGTSDALELAGNLSGQKEFSVVYSLAGRVNQPRLPDCEIRIGGFGGIDGLSSYLIEEHIQAIIDATHPFAARITQHIDQASRQLGLPLLALVRPPWTALPEDIWHEVPDLQGAATAIPHLGKRVLLAVGRQEVSIFAQCTNEYFLIRSIEPPSEPLPPNSNILLARGPFQLEDEIKLLRDHRIDLIVSKNSGGAATYPKIQAARELGIPVVLVQRRPASQALSVTTVSSALAWLHKLS